MIELERTFLAKYLPDDLDQVPPKDLLDVYVPATADHPTLRIRKRGETYEITKKEPVKEGDSSEQHEYTVPLTQEEFEVLSQIPGKRLHKTRYAYPYQGITTEIDVFQDDLAGLVLVDFEFESTEEKNAFTPPDFCGADVTQETFIAGGMLCGKTYRDIAQKLEKYGYQPISL